MLETDDSGLGEQYHACWCPGSLRRQGISSNVLIAKDRQHVGFRQYVSSFLLLNKIQDMMRNVNTSFIIFKTIQQVKS